MAANNEQISIYTINVRDRNNLNYTMETLYTVEAIQQKCNADPDAWKQFINDAIARDKKEAVQLHMTIDDVQLNLDAFNCKGAFNSFNKGLTIS